MSWASIIEAVALIWIHDNDNVAGFVFFFHTTSLEFLSIDSLKWAYFCFLCLCLSSLLSPLSISPLCFFSPLSLFLLYLFSLHLFSLLSCLFSPLCPLSLLSSFSCLISLFYICSLLCPLSLCLLSALSTLSSVSCPLHLFILSLSLISFFSPSPHLSALPSSVRCGQLLIGCSVHCNVSARRLKLWHWAKSGIQTHC